MTKLLIIVTAFILVYSQTAYKAPSIREILKRSENQIDIGEAALVLAKDFYPNLNIPYFLEAFDYLAQRFEALMKTGDYSKPIDKIKLLNTYLYKKGWWNDSISFSYDDEDYFLNGFHGIRKKSNKFINGYIATKKGSCITMPMLYLIIAERINLPLYPVISPKHFFVRYIPKDLTETFEANIETTNGGSFLSDQTYIDDAGIPKRAIENGVYLKTLTKKEFIAALLAINGTRFADNKNYKKAKSYLWLSLKYNKKLAMAYWNYAQIHYELAMNDIKLMEFEIKNEINFYEILSKRFEKITEDKSARRNDYTYNSNIWIPKLSEQDFGNFRFTSNNDFKTLINQKPEKIQRPGIRLSVSKKYSTEMQHSILQIELEFSRKIRENLKTFEKYKEYAKYLGIVKEFPSAFFEKQLKMFKLYVKEGKIKL